MKAQFFLALALLVLAVICDESAKEQGEVFVAPKADGAVFLETFSDDSWKQRWHRVDKAPYTGKWDIGSGSKNKGISGDEGLIMTTAGQRHAIAAAFSKPEDNKGKTLIVQYELRAENKFGCDGGYIKLLSDLKFSPEDFNDSTPYTIMFGPDKCGTTDKVHFILRHAHPKTGKFEEKHLKDAPRVPNDGLTHVYTLIIRPDNTFEVLIDEVSKSIGSLFEAFDPPVNPPKEINDPSDKKPADWVDNEYINDPEDKKPEDWDDDAPQMIEDESATKPETWLDDAPSTIPDPEAKQPEDWDAEEDGDWEAPHIPNPACETSGCGEWKRPTIKNPNYKGKWSPKKIKNPAYIGEWKPKKIPNPDYVEDNEPHSVFPIAGVGIELLSNSGGLVFDNILITHDEASAAKFRENTWARRHNREKTEYADDFKSGKKKDDWASTISNLFAEYPIPICIGILCLAMLIFLIIYRFCLSGPVDEVAHAKKTDAHTADDSDSHASSARAEEHSQQSSEDTAATGSKSAEKKKATNRKTKKDSQ